MNKTLEEYLAIELEDLDNKFSEIEVYEVENSVGSNVDSYNNALMRLRELKSRIKRLGEE